MSDEKPMKCDFCTQPAVALIGETNGTLACERHAKAFRGRTMGDEREEYISDGFGSEWPTCGTGCDLQVVRPGKVQCNRRGSNCPDRREVIPDGE